MAKAVWLQRVVEPDWVLMQNQHCPMCPSALNPSVVPGPVSDQQPQALALHRPATAPPGSGEAAALQEVSSVSVLGEGCLRVVQVLGEARLPSPPHVGLALKLEPSELKGGGYRPEECRSGATAPPGTTRGSWTHKAHPTHWLVSLGQSLTLSGPQSPQL